MLLCTSPGHAAALQLHSDTDVATAGYFQLQWQGDAGNYQLEEARNAEFHQPQVIYQGTDTATVISGKANGEYYYRIGQRAMPSPVYSNSVKVTVAHHSLLEAWLFFTAGALVFIAILLMIIKGNRLSATH